MREGEKQDGKEKEEEEEERSRNHLKRLRMTARENQDEKAAGTSCIEISGREMKSLEGVEQKEGVEKKTDFDLREELEKRDDKILAEKQKSEIQSLEEGEKSQRSHSGEVGKFGNKSVRTKAAESNDGEGEEKERKKEKEDLEEEEEGGGVGISLALSVASRSVWPHLTG